MNNHNMHMTSEEFAAWVAHFGATYSTDETYTPPKVYDAVADFVAKHYDLDRNTFVRPFYPGGDYQSEDYDGVVVVDNPPFSILAKIVDFYRSNHVKFFMWCNGSTCIGILNRRDDICVVAGTQGIYDKEQSVALAFVTNLEPDSAVVCYSDLMRAIEEAQKKYKKSKEKPKYEYNDHVFGVKDIMRYSRYHIDYRLNREDVSYTGRLDMQRPLKKGIFGGGLLMSDKAAADKAAADKAAAEKVGVIIWELSEREQAIVDDLNRHSKA